MTGALLQVGLGVSPRLLVQVGELVGAFVGVFIAYQAYRGYRRNDSRPMLYIAAGFALILAAPLPLVAGYYLPPLDAQVALQGTIQLLELAGLGCIVYALRMEP